MPERYRYQADYRADPARCRRLEALALRVFDLDLTSWQENDRYVPHSLFDGDTLVSNVSASRQDFRIGGRIWRTLQLGTVMTDPAYRGQGCAAGLITKVVDLWKDRVDFIFLYANELVLDFYPRFGFVPASQEQTVLSLPRDGRGEGRKIDLSVPEDLALVRRLAAEALPASPSCYLTDGQALLRFYLEGLFADALWYLPDRDLLAVLGLDGEETLIYDLFSPRPYALEAVLPRIAPSGCRTLRLGFTPDGTGRLKAVHVPAGDPFFVDGDAPPFDGRMLPLLSHT